ncbi:siderophore-interacting protein [Nocardioides alcanivorans]|uniref:siderophore-interacting protein n=1 Tax=Nocardioides alcanivorans TaxID=2897352 RepID=UPI001F2A3644|nr:siderophore-interacting protein [Nocardioides alcanivorans]
MTETATMLPPMIVDEVEVMAVELLTPTFVRIEFGGPALAEFGVDGPTWDQRVKLIFPNASGELAQFDRSGAENWYTAWTELSDDERGHMRTYTVRRVIGRGEGTRLVIDFVLHLVPGASGPASRWAAAARPGDKLVLVGPRLGSDFGGIEFQPGTARSLLLVGDETAVPAVSAILEQLPANAVGTALLEVPLTADILHLIAPPGVEVIWLPRNGQKHGEPLTAAVRDHFGLDDKAIDLAAVPDDVVDPDLWETPTWSSSGEEIVESRIVGHDLAGIYAWIAGESKVVTALRRVLVKELEIDRSQVAFMGYWRQGVAMRS